MDRAQGIAHPDELSISHARVSTNERTHSDLYQAFAHLWSPRRTVRVDPSREHDYSASMVAPKQAPDYPWAVYLASLDHRFRLLAFDFDSSRLGPDQARTDSDRLAAHLDNLGVPYLRAHSGPGGGQHIWLRLGENGADPAAVGELNHVLEQHYATFDTSPLSKPHMGVVRPPGAPHRGGGRSVPHLAGAELQQALEQVGRGTTPEVVTWLLARHAHTPPVRRPIAPISAAMRAIPIRIGDPTTNPHLDRPRRPLSAATQELLDTAPGKSADRSAITHSVFLGMACAGHTLNDARIAAESAPGLVRLREDRDKGRDDLARQWDRALQRAATFAYVPDSDNHQEPLDEDLDTIERALTVHAARFAQPGGESDERILYALITFARTARTRTLDIDCRRLAQRAGLAASTISRRLRVLAQTGWVTQTYAAAGTRAASWTLNLPPKGWEHAAATQGNPPPALAPASTLLTHHTHDLWSPRPGLGAASARIHWALLSGASTPQAIAGVTGYSLKTVEKALLRLSRLCLVGVGLRSAESDNGQLHTAAKELGLAEVSAGRRERHVIDRELFAWWNDEQAWRRRKGKKRGPTRTAGMATTLALPIDGPARIKYGRFPTKPGGRADYRTARATVRGYLAPAEGVAA
ncbi:helix-turn-helix domain-containing protein [Rhodococcus koreensis]